MSRRNRTNRKRSKGKYFVQLEHYLLDSPAYRSLTANAKVIYTELKRRYNSKNNGTLAMSAREAGESLNASYKTGARALLELQERGFIAVTEESSFTRKVHMSRCYRLTEAPDDRPGQVRIPSKEFLKWSANEAEKSKTQCHPRHTTVSPTTHHAERAEVDGNHSVTHDTVLDEMDVSQCHPRHTYTLSASQPSSLHDAAQPAKDARRSYERASTQQASDWVEMKDLIPAFLQKRSGGDLDG